MPSLAQRRRPLVKTIQWKDRNLANGLLSRRPCLFLRRRSDEEENSSSQEEEENQE
jgi:hypothetical protein